MTYLDTEQSAGMTTAEGDRVRARRVRIGMDKIDLAKLARVSRDTVAAIEDGKGYRASSLSKIERALDKLEEEMGIDAPPAVQTPGDLVEFEVTGDFGVRVVVRGPVADLPQLQRSVADLVRGMRGRDSDEGGDNGTVQTT